MDWTKLFKMQQELDSYIETTHHLADKDLFSDKFLAFLVELGELANETRCFKFWSNKRRSEKDIIVEEYVDGIHFILSLGIEKGFTYASNSDHLSELNQSETAQFIKIFESAILFKNKSNQKNYVQLFDDYLQLGQLLGFTEDDIKNAYYKKNEKNFARQNEGY